MRFNCNEHSIEKDILLTEFNFKKIQEINYVKPKSDEPWDDIRNTKGLVIEVNGIFHYPRNSELPLGKDLIK